MSVPVATFYLPSAEVLCDCRAGRPCIRDGQRSRVNCCAPEIDDMEGSGLVRGEATTTFADLTRFVPARTRTRSELSGLEQCQHLNSGFTSALGDLPAGGFSKPL